MTVEYMTINVQIEGKLYRVVLGDTNLSLLADAIAMACGGQLKIAPLPPEYKLVEINK